MMHDFAFNYSMCRWPQAQASWFAVWVDAVSLAIDASTVIGLRAGVLAQGGKAASAEAFDMVNEKIAAALALQNKALTGGLGMTARTILANTVDHYLPKVRENRKRLVLIS